MATKMLVCLVMLAATTLAVPVIRDDFDSEYDSYRCARKCKASPFKFDYKTSETYVYEYKAEAETSLAVATEDKARMYIEAHANIEVIDQCEFALRLQNVKVYHSEPYSDSLKPSERSQDFQRALTENTLRFSFDDGIISDICHPSQEKIWVLNFKRGLLSAFQNSMDKFKDQKVKEVDVTGECDVEYKSNKWSRWSSTKVTKSKDLLACYQRSGLKTFIPLVPYKIASDIQSLPIMKSTYSCDQSISTSKILESSICKESHVFAPLSKQQSGAATKILQTLTFKAVVKSGIETSLDYVESRSNLLFQHVNGIDEVPNSREAAEQKLKEICEQTKTDIRPETPRLFTELVQIVKDLDSSDLRDLYRMIKSKKLCSQNDRSMKFLLDTLPIAGTPGAVELMVTAINGDDLPDLEKNVWLTSLSLIPEPTEDMLPSLLKLVSGNSGDKALLPVTALLNTMCKKSVNCDRSYQFKKIVKKISSSVDSSCSSQDRSQLMMTLRAIGNVGHGKNFLQTLKTCLTSRNAPLEVKVAAADAYRRFQCQDDEETGPLFEVFESKEADVELRIMSFLSLMRCPRDTVLTKIADQLDKEEDAHVGTFVYTHLQNLKQTSDPHKQDISKAVERLNLKKFDGSGLKTSRCFESSNLLNKLNLGYVADGDLIWSQSSMVPRAMRLNLTVDLFGNSVNLFEAGARMDGLDRFIQKYFGMEGYLAQNELNPEDLEAFIYARVFGNEVFFKHMKGTQEFEKIKSMLDFDKLLENLSQNFNIGYTHSQQLMDHSLVIPTAIGLPVNMTVNSSVTVDTRAKGKFDFSGILSRSKPIAVSNDITASAGLEVSGSMMVDAQLYKQGLRMRNTLHSSVSMKSNLKIIERQIVNFQIDSPEQKQELIDARSQLFIIHDNFEKEQEMIKGSSEQINSCTGDKFSKVTGVELCGELQYPKSFPSLGPARATLVLNKKDTQRSYKIFAKWIHTSKKIQSHLLLDTPGSKVDRHISSDISIGFNKRPEVEITLNSPWKKIALNGKATKNNDMASLNLSLAVDGDIQYKLTSQLKMSSKSKSHEYLPFVEIENNGERITLLSGSATHNEKNNIISNLELKDLKQNSYTLGGQLVYTPQEKRIELSAGRKGEKPYLLRTGSTFKTSGRKNQNIKIDPDFLIQYSKGEIVSLKSEGEFQSKPLKVVGNIDLNTIRMKKPIVLKVDVKEKNQNYPVSLKLSSPLITGDVKGKVTVRKTGYISDIKMNYKVGSISDKITWNGKLLDRSKNSYTKYNLKSVLRFKKMPEYNTESNLDIENKWKKDYQIENSANLKIYYGKDSKAAKNNLIQIVTSVNADFADSEKAEMKAYVKAKAPVKDIDINIEMDHQHNPKKVDSAVKFHLSPLLENDVNANIRIQDKSKSLIHVSAEGNLEARGQKYTLNSNLNQKSQRRYEHSLTVWTGDEDKHTLVTVYKNPNNQILSTLESTQMEKPLSLELSSDMKSPLEFQINGAVKEGNRDLYSIDALSKLEDGMAGKWNLELAYPKRKMKANAKFNNLKNKITASALVNWDVDSRDKKTPEIELTGQLTHISEPDSLLLKGNVKLNTPFKNWEKLGSNWILDKSEQKLKSTGKLLWGGIHKQFSTDLTATLPLSIDNTKVTFHAKTPFKDYKDVEFEVDHMLNSEIKTTLRGKVNREQTELILNGKKNVNDYSRSIEGDLTLKTPYRSAREIRLSLEHSDDDNEIRSSVKINKDDLQYSANLLSSLKYDSERSGELKLSGPERSAQTTFKHKLQDGKHQIEASIDSTLNNNRRRYNVDVTGYLQDLSNLKLNVDVKSPLKSLRKGGLEIGLQLEDGTLESKIILTQNRGKTGYDITLKNKQNEKSADVLLLLSPLYENDVYLKSSVEYDTFPVTVSTQFSWAPSSVIDLTGSYKAQHIDDLEVNMKLTTPFEKLENINLVFSNVLENSVRVSHLNFDYDIRKMVDVEVRRQNDDERKLLRLNVKVPSFPFKSLDTGFDIDMTRGLFSKADLELLVTQEEKYEGFVSLKVSRNDNVRGKLDIKTPVDGYKHIEGNLVSEGNTYTTNSLLLSVEDIKVVDISAETENRGGKFGITVITQGTWFKYVAQEITDFMEETEIDDVLPKFLKYEKENAQKLTAKFEMEETNGQEKWTITLTPDFPKGERSVVFMHKQSVESWKDFNVESSLTIDGDSLTGKLLVKLLDDIKFESEIKFPHDESLAAEFSLSGDVDQLESKGRIRLFFHEANFDFKMNGIQNIQFTSTTKKIYSKSRLITVKYTHEGQDNRASCSFSVEDVKGIRASIDLVGQTSPVHLFSLIMKTPFKDYKKIIISGDYDETKVNGLVQIKENQQFSLSGIHNNLKNPQFTLKTPLRQLQVLSINLNGDLNDGSSTFTLQFNDNDQLDGNVAIEYETPSQLKMISALNTKISNSENNWKFEVENKKDTERLLLSLNDLDKIAYSTSVGTDYNGDQKLDVDLNMMFPSLSTKTQGLTLHVEGNTKKASGYVAVLDDSGLKTLDADFNIDILSDKIATLTFSKPRLMEYSLTKGSFQNDNEIYLNWDKTNPDAKLVITATLKDDSSYYKLDKTMSLILSCPSRSIGVEHAITATSRTLESSGRLFWDSDTESQLGYELTMKDLSNRRQNAYNGELKFKLPTRTIGIAGSASDLNSQVQAETTLSWDLDNDSTKKVGLKGTLLKAAHTQMDVSLILPQDAHVDSKLVLSKGNTIVEGQTQFFYSSDSRKTLTVFSKLENNPEQSSYFYSSKDNYNYSIQLGVSHPDSRIDVKMVSHLGYDSERLTTSVGLDYLTSRRQMKNVDLFVEINKLKKEINLVTNTPYKSIGLSGAVISQDPVEYKGSMTVDDVERYAARLFVDPNQKKANFHWINDGTQFRYSAFYPNKTALQVQREQQIDGPMVQDYKVLFQLSSPNVLQTTLNWRHGLVVETRDMLFDNTERFWIELKQFTDDVGDNLRREVEQKYRDVVVTMLDEVKSVVNSVEQQLWTLENDMDRLEQKLQQEFKFCNFELSDLVPVDVFLKGKPNIKPILTRLREILQSLSGDLDELKRISASKVYFSLMKYIENFEKQLFTTSFWSFFRELHKVPQERFDNFWDEFDEFIQTLDPQEGIDAINKEMEKLKNVRISTLIWNIIENTELVTKLRKLINEEVINEQEIRETIENSEIYRKAKQMGLVESVPEPKEVISFISQVVDVELRELLDDLRILRNPITIFDPERGILQVELPIFISLDRLDQVPSLQHVSGNVVNYIPFYGSNVSSPVDEVVVAGDGLDGFNTYEPSRRYRPNPRHIYQLRNSQ